MSIFDDPPVFLTVYLIALIITGIAAVECYLGDHWALLGWCAVSGGLCFVLATAATIQYVASIFSERSGVVEDLLDRRSMILAGGLSLVNLMVIGWV